jgi:hypothetical protein
LANVENYLPKVAQSGIVADRTHVFTNKGGVKIMARTVWFVVLIFIPVTFAHADVDPENVIGVWLLDDDRGNTAEDSSGNGNDGQIAGAKLVDGKFGKALRFEDSGDVSIASTEKLQLGEELTMMAYFYAEALNDWHQLIAKDAEYLLRIDPPAEGGNMSAFVSIDGSWEPRASAGVPVTEVWTHFAAVYTSDDTLLRVYVNGELKGQSARPGKPGAGGAPVTIGHWGGSSNFVGIIDEVAIFNTALEEDDIKDIAADGLVAFLSVDQSVEPAGKLANTWGRLKDQ